MKEKILIFSEKFITSLFIIFAVFFIGALIRNSYAGSLAPTAGPASTMYTLGDIYNKLSNNAFSATEGGASFAIPGSISSTYNTLKEIYESIPNIDASKIVAGTIYMGVAGTFSPDGSLLKTGQTGCWDVLGDPVPCAGSGQDGEYQKGLPASGAQFTDNNDGTISDNVTNLMWIKCTEGQSELDCSVDTGTTYNWSNAITLCESETVAGHTDWRLPNRNELGSLVNFGSFPSIDATFFPNTRTSGGKYWSSTTFSDLISAWVVEFETGRIVDTSKSSNGLFVRCVRG